MTQPKLVAEIFERRVGVRPELVRHREWFGIHHHLARNDGVHAEILEARAKIALEQIESDQDHRGDGDQQASDKNSGQDATRLFQPARPGVLPKVGSD